MSPAFPRRRAIVLGFAGLGLGGCGFQPVYMPTASGNPGVAQRELAAIDVGIIPDRPGQLLRQALQDRFANDAGGPHKYSLSVQYWIAGENVGILTDNSASRIRLVGTANWVLTARDADRTRLLTGSTRSVDAFNLFENQYFAATLENEAVQRRIAGALADQLSMQLATWFRNRANPARAISSQMEPFGGSEIAAKHAKS